MATPRKGPRLGRDPKHQKLIISTLACQFFTHGAVETTLAKAKYVRPELEKLISKARKGNNQHIQRQLVAKLRDKGVAHKLVEEIAPKYKNRQGGYIRILKLGPRDGDKSPMARMELV
ncbi:MAG TPA: 50S ribosomal protein L17 [Acidimicrobiia bacterium]|nr:50S ribosomal protein L17 [Acidimicrobiia bacterium]